MTGALRTLVVLAFFAVSGLPIAWSVRRHRHDPIRLLFESSVIGLVVQELIALVASHAGHYTLPVVVAATVLVSVGTAAVLRRVRRTGESHLAPPAPEATARPAWSTLGIVVVIGVALAFRGGPSYFIFQTGDMGGYVNGANILTRSAQFSVLSLHGFTVFLRETNLLLGRAHTVAGLPALGIVFLLGVAALGRALGLHAIAVLAVAAIVALHPVITWFSLFPVSEALAGVLLLGALYLLVLARTEVSHAYAALAGIVLASSLLARGEAMLFAPVVVIALLASAALDAQPLFEVERTFAFTTLIGLALAYAYDVHFVNRYFLGELHLLAPGFLVRTGERLHLLDATPLLLIAVVIMLGAVLGAVALVTRYVRPRTADMDAEPVWRVLYLAVVALTGIVLATMPLGGLTDTLSRWGAVLLVLSGVGIAVIVLRPARYLDGVTGLVFLLTVCAYSILFAHRVKVAKPQVYFLYFDRYLYSEVLPVALVLAGIGAHAIIIGWRRVAPRAWYRVGIAALVVITAFGLAPEVRETRVITRYPLFADSYGALNRLDDLTRGDGHAAIVYSGLPFRPRGWFFENTFREFALPLVQSFRRTVLGMPAAPTSRDPRFEPAGARRLLAAAGFRTGYLIALEGPGAATIRPGAHARHVGTVVYKCPTLGMKLHNNPPPRWHLFLLRFDVYELS